MKIQTPELLEILKITVRSFFKRNPVFFFFLFVVIWETIILFCWSGTFGPCGWSLPAVELEHPAGPDRVRLFAKFILEGRVAPQLEKFTSR